MKNSKIRQKLLTLAMSAAIGAAALPAARAGTASFDFSSDPTGVLDLIGNASWVPDGGNPGGYLQITAPTGSQLGTIIFNDFDNGLVVKAFTFSADLKVGDGSAQPADGFSINFAREGSDVLVSQGASGFGSMGNAINAPEEGTTSGLAIGFDAFQNGDLATDHGLPDGDVHYDTIGISVRVDNVLIFQKPMRTLNGASNDVTSLQTGPIDTANPGSGSLLTWQPFKVELTEDGKVNIWWKGAQIVTNLATSYFPSRGQLVFSGRTGGSYQIQAVDNIQITTVPADKPSLSYAALDAYGLTVRITDTAAVAAQTNTVVLKFNGQVVSPNSLTKVGAVTSIRYNTPNLLASGATYPVEVSFSDTSNQTSDVLRDITVPTFALLSPSFAVAETNVDKTKPGFRIRPYQVASGQPNTIAWTEEMLAGKHGTNLADLTAADASGYLDRPTVIAFANSSVSPTNFPTYSPFSEVGIPGPTLLTEDNSAMEILTFLEFPTAGIYTFGVGSDDGYQLATAANVKDILPVIVGHLDAVANDLLTVVVPQAGIYPFRLVWENGGGGALLQWYSVDAQGTQILINDTATPGAIKAYRSAKQPVYLATAYPKPGDTQTPANSDIVLSIVDGDLNPLDNSTVAVQLNSQARTVTTSKAGSVTTIKSASTELLSPGSTNTVTLVYGDSATPAHMTTNQWIFQVAPLASLSSTQATVVGSGDKTVPGFAAKVYQVDELGTTAVIGQVTFFEQVLAGAVGPNTANMQGAVNGVFPITGAINWNIAYQTASDGDFTNDTAVPGLPGSAYSAHINDNIAAEIITYVEFPTAGYYALGVNSDDGFRMTAGTNGPASNGALVVNTPASVKGSYYALTAGRNQTGGIGLDITTNISGKLVYADPPLADLPLNNAAAISNNIALIDRGTVSFQAKLDAALAAGAIAVVIANNRTPDSGEGVYPIVLGGNNSDIPAVMIGMTDGDMIKSGLPDGVTVTITAPDYAPGLMQFDNTRGASDSITGIQVPRAGVYPLRLVWFQQGGGGSLEWFTVLSDGTKVLLNDPNNPKALKAYRARTGVPPVEPTLSFQTASGQLTLTFTGVLQSAATVDGTYSDLTGTNSPAVITMGEGKQFYRARSN